MNSSVPVVRDVCLVGGGHSHTLLLRRWAMRPLAGVRLTLVSSSVLTPYSGMLPGLIAGHYTHEDIHIDLMRLCAWANVRFIEDTVTGINLQRKQIVFDTRPGIAFDVLSLDTGSTPDLSVPGAAQHVTPVKPVSDFHSRWESIQQRLTDAQGQRFSIGVVGSGAGGFELVTAIRHRLRATGAQCRWFLRGDNAISGRAAGVGRRAIAAAEAAGIEVVRAFDVVRVEPGCLIARDGRVADLDEIVWCTAAAAPEWPSASGLETDERGFVATNAHLQSRSHPFVFATGDIGTQIATPSNKAGVFAVRQAPVLCENIRRYLLGDALQVYTPQNDFLSLMATGGKQAIASRGPLIAQGDWVWRWKDRIDQRFMNRFRYLPRLAMNASLSRLPNGLKEQPLRAPQQQRKETSVESVHDLFPEASPAPMRCRGCGAKVGNDVLQRVLDELLPEDASNGTARPWSPAGDAAVMQLAEPWLVQSVDQINAIVDDPYLLGRIAALHAISDVITLQSQPHSAQVLLTLPEASERVVERDLRQVMAGLLSVLNDENCPLVGGHTAQGPELSIGLTINATMPGAAPAGPAAGQAIVQVGDALIMTKALGVGTLFAGLMQGKAQGPDIMTAIDSMQTGNRHAANILRRYGSVGMTDITGFGLLGHLLRLLQGLTLDNQPGSSEQLWPGILLGLDRVALLPGALALSRSGCRSSLWPQNSQVFSEMNIDKHCDGAQTALLADPQTSGGLLAVVPHARHRECVAALVAAGYGQAALIGFIDSPGSLRIAPTLDRS